MAVFDKPALTPRQQLDLLLERNLRVQNQDSAVRLLEVVSHFRLTPYMRPFQINGDPNHRFRDGTQLNDIVKVYRFDSDLRQLIMVGLEKVEVAARACISNHMASTYGSHWYLDRARFSNRFHHGRLIADIESTLSTERMRFYRERQQIMDSHVSDEVKVQRIENRMRDNYPRFYAENYSDPPLPPSWAVVEDLSFGAVSMLYKGLAQDRDRKTIAKRFHLPHRVLGSWLHTLTFVRNICAHHARLWNRELAIPPEWPKNLAMPNDKENRQVSRRLYTVLCMMAFLTHRISPDTRWLGRLVELINAHPMISKQVMGFPSDWENQLHQLAAVAIPEN